MWGAPRIIVAGTLIGACAAFGTAGVPDAGPDASAPTGDAAFDGGSSDGGGRSDSATCGGRDCLGGACVEGRCQPVAIATGLDKPWYLAVGRNDVFVTSFRPDAGGAIVRVKKDGSDAVVISAEVGFDVAVTPDWVYVCNEETGLVRMRHDGTDRHSLFTVGCLEIQILGEELYVTQSIMGRVVRLIPPGEPVTVISNLPSAEGLAVDTNDVYVAQLHVDGVSGAGRVVRAPRLGTTSEPRVLVEGVNPRRLAIDGADVFVVDINDNHVRRIPKDGGAPLTVAESPRPVGVGGVLLLGDFVYWINTSSGKLLRARKDGSGDPEPLAENLVRPVDLAADESALYITDEGAGAVLKLALP